MNRIFLTLLLLCLSAPFALGADQSTLDRVSTRNQDVTLSFSSPIVYRIERFNRSARLVMNLYSVRYDGTVRELTRLKAPWLKNVRTEVILADSVRVTLALRDDIQIEVFGVPPASTIILSPNRKAAKRSDFVEEIRPLDGQPDPNRNPPVRQEPEPIAERPAPVVTSPASSARVQVTRMDFQHGDTLCRLQLDLTGPVRPQAFLLTTNPRSPRLVLDLPNAQVVPAEQSIPVPSNPLVRQLRVGVFEKRGARVVFDLKRKVEFSVTSDKQTGQVVLSLGTDGVPEGDPANSYTPDIPEGTDEPTGVPPTLEAGGLEGRTIIIDAGHGGHDSGTRGHGLVEKQVALDISKRLYNTLRAAGVNAILTRDDDRFLRLPDRPAVANRIGADAFVAVHLNSTGSVRNIWSGTETYYHMQDPVGRELAQHIQAQLVQAIGLPDRGAKSDTRIAPRMGFSVLRNSQVPAVLVEVGYLNHPGDAGKLKNPEFRQRAAEGIMAGLRSYFSRGRQTSRRSVGR